MCGVTRLDRIRHEYVRCLSEINLVWKIKEIRLRWISYVEEKNHKGIVKMVNKIR